MFKKTLVKIKKALKNKRGAIESINTAIALLMILSLLVFFIDLMLYTRTYIGMSNFADGIARTLEIQGGVSDTIPSGFPGGEALYLNKTEITEKAKTIANKYKLNIDEITIYAQSKNYNSKSTQFTFINNKDINFRPNSATEVAALTVDYENPIKVCMQYSFDWTLSTNSTNVKVGGNSISNYKHRDNTWNTK